MLFWLFDQLFISIVHLFFVCFYLYVVIRASVRSRWLNTNIVGTISWRTGFRSALSGLQVVSNQALNFIYQRAV